MLVRCPTCRNTFSAERTGPQDCPVCGKPLVVPEQAGAQAAAAAGAPHDGPAPGTPWEHRAELGFFKAWWNTVKLGLTEPAALFRSARPGSESAALGFAVVTSTAAIAVGQLFQLVFFRAQMREAMERLAERNVDLGELAKVQELMTSPWFALGLLVLAPLMTVVSIYLNSGVTHLSAMLLGKPRRGFGGTFLAVTYAYAPAVLTALPGCGGMIAAIWMLVLICIGLSEIQGLGSGRSAAATFGPLALLVCCGCSLGIAAAVLARHHG